MRAERGINELSSEKRASTSVAQLGLKWEEARVQRALIAKEECAVAKRFTGSSSTPGGEEEPSGRKGLPKRILEFKSYNTGAAGGEDAFGDFENEDKPHNIKKARKVEDGVEFIVEWMPRENGFQPKDSVVTSQEFRRFMPEFLLEFYEKRIVFQEE